MIKQINDKSLNDFKEFIKIKNKAKDLGYKSKINLDYDNGLITYNIK